MLSPSLYYHIYNHANGDENLFREQENYRFFLQQYQKHIPDVADTLAYCLMPNHFHLVVRIKSAEELLSTFPKFETLEKLVTSNFISKQFSNLFSSYTQAFNKKYNRRGSLFIKNFKRKEITLNQQLIAAILYVHNNAVHHGFTDQFTDWQWTSYHHLTGEEDCWLYKQEVLELFEGQARFHQMHITYEKEKQKNIAALNPMGFND